MTIKKLTELHDLMVEDLIEKIKSGDATPATLNVARQLLKDNNIEALPTENSHLKSLIEELPFDEEENQSYGGTQ
jgi:hypothetical protein